jgi:hypothetical protein
MRRTLFTVALVTALVSVAAATAAKTHKNAVGVAISGSWTHASPVSSPPARYWPVMARDKNGSVLLFGGNGASPGLGDTWLWDGSNWSQPSASTAPSGRSAAAAATDASGNVVLFGGGVGLALKNDTWSWNGTSWTQLTPSLSPPARYGATMALDKNGKVILFGGQDATTTNLSDTWLFDGSNWTQAPPGTSPPARVNASMATDKNGNVVLFGGAGAGNVALGDTWLWNGTNWSQASPASSPPAGNASGIATDSNGNVILFVGFASSGSGTTWAWDGTNWSQVNTGTSPPSRVNPGMATDKNGNIVLFGGFQGGTGALNDTWLFSSQSAPDTTPPVLTLPANMIAAATSPAGATVTFAASAVDAVDGPVPVTCVPPSGGTFPRGTTTVTCSASDKSGNVATGSFTVTVNDVTPPTTPTKLTTPGRGQTMAVLTWGPSTDPDDTALIYDIYVNDKRVGDTGGLRFMVTGLHCGTSYVFGVGARDNAGNGSPGRVAKVAATLACG